VLALQLRVNGARHELRRGSHARWPSTSGIGARTGHTDLSRTLVRTLTVGLGTLGVSYLVGRLVF
jgi:hypothetical protein